VPEAAYFIPPLTTVRPAFAAVAQAGLDLLLAQITDPSTPPNRVVIAPRLVERASVAPPA